MILVEAGSTVENQILWLFGLNGSVHRKFTVTELEREGEQELSYAAKFILAELGIEVVETAPDYLEMMLSRFGGGFPTTKEFSAFSRETLENVSAEDSADDALMAWLNREEILFRTLERHLVEDKLKEGFDDVDVFIKYSLSIQNRRKSRAGYALENHMVEILNQRKVKHSRGEETENKSKPDFLFPGITHYRDPEFPAASLTMLGAKSSCKERWRQVLAEAARIEKKHLLTLEPGISENQTNEMMANKLQLVVPREVHVTYLDRQQEWLYDLDSFVELVNERQEGL